MKSKTIKQYSCDFCKKKGLSASHVSRHEKACTNNPKRICNMCKMEWAEDAKNIGDINNIFIRLKNEFAEKIQKTLSVLTEEQKQDYPPFVVPLGEREPKYLEVEKLLLESVLWLESEVNYCPACTLSIIRQTGNCRILRNVFDYKKEKESWWNEKNELEREKEGRSYYY